MRYLPRSRDSRLDEWFLTKLPEILLSLVLIGLLQGCGSMSSIGLRPEYPPLQKGGFRLWGEFVEVDSLQPTLRWQGFPRAEDLEAHGAEALERVEDVSYELRIWKTVNGYSGRLVYAREGLALPEHELETALEPASKYLWTVRARFVLDGLARVTEWGLAGYVLRDTVVPNPSCFRFITPASRAGG